ncbi:MAG: hypothetical protein J7M34_09685 [Anaerolineae bacterium]|nr:hypothetical protein [Anaerolineae bacterium]
MPAMNNEGKQGIRKWQAGLAIAIILVLIGLAIYALAVNPVRAQIVRDLFIIFIAIEVLAVGVLLSVLIWQVYQLVRMLREEVLPILESGQEAADTVRATTSFIGEHIVSPIAKASGYIAGLREAATTLRNQTEGADCEQQTRRTDKHRPAT